MAYMSPDSNTHANVSIFLTQLSTAPDNQSDSYADNMDINVDPDRSAFDHINESLDLYVKPLMYIFGIVGNLTSFAVFMCTFMRHSSSSIYLAALAISDTVFILCTLIAWSDNFNWRLSHQPIICQLNVFVSYVAGFLSVWYVVGFTIERCLAIQFPLKRQVSLSLRIVPSIVTGKLMTTRIIVNTTSDRYTNLCHDDSYKYENNTKTYNLHMMIRKKK